jgi:hypothetical protein
MEDSIRRRMDIEPRMGVIMFILSDTGSTPDPSPDEVADIIPTRPGFANPLVSDVVVNKGRDRWTPNLNENGFPVEVAFMEETMAPSVIEDAVEEIVDTLEREYRVTVPDNLIEYKAFLPLTG